MKTKLYLTSKDIDVMLVTEGTYPFVVGGVASWTEKLIKFLPEVRFGVVFIGGMESDYLSLKCELPFNLVHLEAHFIFEEEVFVPQIKTFAKKDFTKIYDMHEKFKSTRGDYISIIRLLCEELTQHDHLDVEEFLYSEEAWNYIVHTYNERCPEISFLDYFWSVRNMHLPLWELIKIAPQIPYAHAYHTLSTGYAGFLATLLHEQTKRPLILTEHGIYTKERKIDLLQHQWAIVGHHTEQRIASTTQYISQLWVSFFQVLAKFCYAVASPTIALFSDYQRQQIEAGANSRVAQIIPNGVVAYPNEIKKEPNTEKPIIAVIGRVVPIKDIKTFISAMLLVREAIPDATAWIVGPLDVDTAYVDECMHLANVLNISDKIIYKGMQNIHDILPHIDLVVISSISEGMPLVLLECFSAGIPAVATDVGSCRELIEGRTEADRAIGNSGIVVNICDPKALASGMIDLLTHKKKWKAAQRAALERVKEHYSFEEFLNNYQKIYREAIHHGRD